MFRNKTWTALFAVAFLAVVAELIGESEDDNKVQQAAEALVSNNTASDTGEDLVTREEPTPVASPTGAPDLPENLPPDIADEIAEAELDYFDDPALDGEVVGEEFSEDEPVGGELRDNDALDDDVVVIIEGNIPAPNGM